MTAIHAWQAVVLGNVEELTEFMPVSSTAHLRISESLMSLPTVSITWLPRRPSPESRPRQTQDTPESQPNRVQTRVPAQRPSTPTQSRGVRPRSLVV